MQYIYGVPSLVLCIVGISHRLAAAVVYLLYDDYAGLWQNRNSSHIDAKYVRVSLSAGIAVIPIAMTSYYEKDF